MLRDRHAIVQVGIVDLTDLLDLDERLEQREALLLEPEVGVGVLDEQSEPVSDDRAPEEHARPHVGADTMLEQVIHNPRRRCVCQFHTLSRYPRSWRYLEHARDMVLS
jgi:hypothetical protein